VEPNSLSNCWERWSQTLYQTVGKGGAKLFIKYILNANYVLYLIMHVTFCFLVTKDLIKEAIWRTWFMRLQELGLKINIITHYSPKHKGNIQSEWLLKTIIPENYLFDTAWGWITKATLSLYKYALENSKADWYSIHSESCVPFISPEKFIKIFQAYKQNTFLSYCKAWWMDSTTTRDTRANLHLLPSEYHFAHPTWCILCHEDLSQIINLSESDKQLTNIITSGHSADESIIAIFLYKINNFKNVVNKLTTITDWKRTPNGCNPYTFNSWTEADINAVKELCADKSKQKYMFLRKIGPDFPDDNVLETTFEKG